MKLDNWNACHVKREPIPTQLEAQSALNVRSVNINKRMQVMCANSVLQELSLQRLEAQDVHRVRLVNIKAGSRAINAINAHQAPSHQMRVTRSVPHVLQGIFKDKEEWLNVSLVLQDFIARGPLAQ